METKKNLSGKRKKKVKDIFSDEVKAKSKRPNRFANVGNREPNPERLNELFGDIGSKTPEKQTPHKKTSPKKTPLKHTSKGMVGPTKKVEGVTIASEFLKVANPIILETQKILSGTCYKVYLRLVFQSWGFQKNYCEVRAPAIAEAIGTASSHVKKALLELEKLGFVKLSQRKRYGKELIVFLPEGTKIQETEIQTPYYETSENETSENFHETSENETPPKYLIKDFSNKTNTPLTPLEGGNRLEIVSGRFPRKPVNWEPWGKILDRIRESIPEEDFEPLLNQPLAVRGGSENEIILKGGYLRSPEDITETLRKALEEEFSGQGIKILKIA